MVYSKKVVARLNTLAYCRELRNTDAEGIGVNLACGSTVRFFLRIEKDGRVADAAFRSNGCGHSRAAADVLAEWVADKQLVDLHGLKSAELHDVIHIKLGGIPGENYACVTAAISALKTAFADYRERRRDEFSGEKALICTCFGVTEARVEDVIKHSQLTSIEQVTDLCNAGGGCGSCQMLIQEMIDSICDNEVML